VFAYDTYAAFALLQSSIHATWALEYGSKLVDRPRYNVTDCFDTFPQPLNCQNLENVGQRYLSGRQCVMDTHGECLTDVYNRFHDPSKESENIVFLRALHVEMDRLVLSLYGWNDLELGHDFRETKQGTRYTISEPARREVLNRLLALNHQRHAEEKAEEMILGTQPKAKSKRGRKAKAHAAHDGVTLFSEVGE
jgi:hypothetical protein